MWLNNSVGQMSFYPSQSRYTGTKSSSQWKCELRLSSRQPEEREISIGTLNQSTSRQQKTTISGPACGWSKKLQAALLQAREPRSGDTLAADYPVLGEANTIQGAKSRMWQRDRSQAYCTPSPCTYCVGWGLFSSLTLKK